MKRELFWPAPVFSCAAWKRSVPQQAGLVPIVEGIAVETASQDIAVAPSLSFTTMILPLRSLNGLDWLLRTISRALVTYPWKITCRVTMRVATL